MGMFPWGMLTPTFLDVVTILKLPVGGTEVHTCPDFSNKDLVYEHDPSFMSLLRCNSNTTGDVTNADHNAFLMYFFNKYFYNNNYFLVVKEMRTFIHLLLSN